MKRPVLEGELAPNVAIQYRLRVLQIQDEVEFSWMEFKQNVIAENFQYYYACIGVLISKLSSAPVFKNSGIDEIWEEYKQIKNTMCVKGSSQKAPNAPDIHLHDFNKLQDIHFKLNNILRESPIYDFDFAPEEVTILE